MKQMGTVTGLYLFDKVDLPAIGDRESHVGV